MRILIRTAVLGLLIAIIIAQKNNKQSTGVGKTDFEPSQTQQKNANEHGDKEESNVEENTPPHTPGNGGLPNNAGGFVFNGNQFGSQNQGPPPPPIVPPVEPREETGGIPPPNRGEPVPINPNFQGPANVPNAPTVVRNGPQVDSRGPINTHRQTGVPLEPNNEPNTGEHGQIPFQFRGQFTTFPKIADLDTPNTQSPTAVKPQEDLDAAHEVGTGREPGGQEAPITIPRNNGPIIEKNRAKNNGQSTQPKSSAKEPAKSTVDSAAFDTAINLKLSEIIKNLSASNILTQEDLSNEQVLKNITDVFTDYVDKAFRERTTPTTQEELEKILQDGSDKVIQHFKANRKTTGNQENFNGGTLKGGTPQRTVNGPRGNSPNGFIIPGQPNGQSPETAFTGSHIPFEQPENGGGISGVIVTAHPLVSLNTETVEEVDTSTDKGIKSSESGNASSPPLFPSQNAPQATNFPSRFNGNNPSSFGKETPLTKSKENAQKTGSSENSHIPTENPRIISSNQEPATISFGNVPFASVTRTNLGQHSNFPTRAPASGGIIGTNDNTPTESPEENREENNPDISPVHSVNRGTIPPTHFKPTPSGEEPPNNSKEVPPFVVETESTNTPRFPPFIPVNTATLPSFVISSFNQFPSTPHQNPLDTHRDRSESSAEVTTEDYSNQGRHIVVVSGGNNNTFYNVSSSGKTWPNEVVPPNKVDEEIVHVQSIAPLHNFQLTSGQPNIINGSHLQSQPFENQPGREHGSPPLFVSEGSHTNNSLEQTGTPWPVGLHREELEAFTASYELSSESSDVYTHFVTRSPIVPLLPVNLNTSGIVPSRNLNNANFELSTSTPFPQPPDWTSPDVEEVNGRPVIVQPAGQANESFVTGPPNHQLWTDRSITEIFPPSSKPEDFTDESHEISTSFEHETSSTRPLFVPFSESSSAVNASSNNSTESTLIIVHPGHILVEPSPEPEPKNASHTWTNNSTIPSVHLFEVSTTTESEEEIEEQSTVNRNSSAIPLFPVIIGNGIQPTKEANVTSSIPAFYTETPIALFNTSLNETSRNFEFSTPSTLLQFVNSSETSTVSSFTSSNLWLNNSAEPNVSPEPSITHGFMLHNVSSSPSENSSAEPSPVPEWTKTSTQFESETGHMKNESSVHPEPEWTKVTGIAVENETASAAPEPVTVKAKASATWSLKLLDIDWETGLNDKLSWQYKDLYGDIYPDLKTIFKDLLKERFVEVTIKHFSQGSVIVNGQVDITEKIDNTRLNDDFVKALQNSGYTLGKHKVDPSTINVDHPGGQAPQIASAKPIGANGVPGYVIGIIVAAIILALVVLAVALLVRRYRTRRLREDHYMVDEETMNGGNGAVKNWQQQQRPANGNGRDNYAAVNMYEMKDNPNGSANPANAHTNYGYQANGHSAPARHNVAEIQLHGDHPIDEDSTRH